MWCIIKRVDWNTRPLMINRLYSTFHLIYKQRPDRIDHVDAAVDSFWTLLFVNERGWSFLPRPLPSASLPQLSSSASLNFLPSVSLPQLPSSASLPQLLSLSFPLSASLPQLPSLNFLSVASLSQLPPPSALMLSLAKASFPHQLPKWFSLLSFLLFFQMLIWSSSYTLKYRMISSKAHLS